MILRRQTEPSSSLTVTVYCPNLTILRVYAFRLAHHQCRLYELLLRW